MPTFGRPGNGPSTSNSRDRETSGLQTSKWSTAKKAPTATWNRLKPVARDELTVYGFPSKGETR
jgi:hypothetical protein